NNAADDTAVLTGLSIQWGTDSPDTQPDPGVCAFTLRDRTGVLAGDFVRLSGARLVLRINEQPTWDDITQFGAYDDCTFPWSQLAPRWDPPIDGGRTHMIYDGIISTGGTIRREKTYWMLDLTATSRMVLWKRMARQGPTSSDPKLAGMHWTGTPQQRLDELNARAGQADAPLADTDGLDLPASVAPYDTDTYPTQLELLQRLYAHSPRRPIWHEDMSGQTVAIGHTDLAVPTGVILDAGAAAYTTDGTTARPAIPADDIQTDDEYTLTITEPWTQATVQGKKATDGDTIQFDDSETSYTAPDLPQQLQTLQKTITLDSDAILDSDTTAYPATTISATDHDRMEAWITALDTIAAPETVIFDSRRIDPYTMPWLYRCQPSGPIFADGPVFADLTHQDGTPTASSVWTTIGGTLTYQWVDGDPVLRSECTVVPMPGMGFNPPTWDMIADWPAAWDQVPLTWAQMKLVAQYLSTDLSTESEET
ncbi:hypothetical protein, partial [Bifidobacterium phasiani]